MARSLHSYKPCQRPAAVNAPKNATRQFIAPSLTKTSESVVIAVEVGPLRPAAAAAIHAVLLVRRGAAPIMSARAVSFMAVFLGHVAPRHMFVVGDFGVTVFFFLSGFLIATLMRSELLGHLRRQS
jgi:hypothetical protein